MAFWGTSIIFDDIPGEEYGMYLLDVGDSKQDDGTMGTKITIVEDRLSRRYDAIDYGITNNVALEFPIVLCGDHFMDRYEMSMIAGWLCGHNEYKYLVICQDDLEGIQYKCKITELKEIHVANMPVAFSATVTCDSPYAYKSPRTDTITCTDTIEYRFHSESNVNGYYYPTMTITTTSSTGNISVVNTTDSSRTFALSGLPSHALTFEIDCLNQIITCSDSTLNPYNYCNFNYPRFVRGDNLLTITGECTVSITSEFPMNVGC
jgi:hypothetical protein